MGRKRHDEKYVLLRDIHTLLAMLVKEGHPIPEDIIDRYIKRKKEPAYKDRYEIFDGDMDDYEFVNPWDEDDLPF